jgi:predicted DNA-binding ribbon-helix-helix protein
VLKKRSVTIAGHRTSIALEPEFWAVLDSMAAAENVAFAQLVIRIDGERGERPLASALRLVALAAARR